VPGDSDRAVLETIYRGTIDALAPAAVVRAALDALDPPATFESRVHVLAIGKAAEPMTRATVTWCLDRGIHVLGGVCIAHHTPAAALPPLDVYRGDHPVPGTASHQAADILGAYVSTAIAPRDRVLVLLSGGASALVGAPRDGLPARDYAQIIGALLGAGLDIRDTNLLRRRLSRWGGGRMGTALLERGASVDVLVISDVPGNDLTAIGSGPCVPDRAGTDTLRACVGRAQLAPEMRDRLFSALEATSGTSEPMTRSIPHHIVSSSSHLAAAVAALAGAMAVPATVNGDTLVGDAHMCGMTIARALIDTRATLRGERVLVGWTGEPTVSLHGATEPCGGRMQALALSAARELHEAGDAGRGITLLAAGTDGRDGPTDAAGAVVSCDTWHAICFSGGSVYSPDRALRERRSHHALQRADALIPAFVSGTNVNDLVIALVSRDA
jgi:glycerate 2-kinase